MGDKQIGRPKEDPKEDLRLSVIDRAKEAAGSKGFVAFFGMITDKVDDSGDPIIEFFYIRDRLSLEDVRKAVVSFNSQLLAEVKEFYGRDLEVGN